MPFCSTLMFPPLPYSFHIYQQSPSGLGSPGGGAGVMASRPMSSADIPVEWSVRRLSWVNM